MGQPVVVVNGGDAEPPAGTGDATTAFAAGAATVVAAQATETAEAAAQAAEVAVAAAAAARETVADAFEAIDALRADMAAALAARDEAWDQLLDLVTEEVTEDDGNAPELVVNTGSGDVDTSSGGEPDKSKPKKKTDAWWGNR